MRIWFLQVFFHIFDLRFALWEQEVQSIIGAKNSARPGTIIHGDHLGQSFILKSDFGFGEPFLHFRAKIFFC